VRINPLFDRLIVKVIRDTKTTGGLFVPEVAFANGPMARGEVLHAGPGSIQPDGARRPMSVKDGDVIWFVRKFADAIPYDGHKAGDVVVMPEEAVIAVLSDLAEVSSLVDTSGETMLIEPKLGVVS
jgi:co-chaperonin GroES (HSP10)